MTEKVKNVDKTAVAEMNRIGEAGELLRSVSDNIERETRRYPRVLNGGCNE